MSAASVMPHWTTGQEASATAARTSGKSALSTARPFFGSDAIKWRFSAAYSWNVGKNSMWAGAMAVSTPIFG